MMRTAPSSVSRLPARARSRAFTASDTAAVPARAKRSCTADATLLTFCPPGPDPRPQVSDRSVSGMTTPGVTSIGMLVELLRPLRQPFCWLEHPQLALGNRYLHAVLAEQPPDRAVDVRADIVDTVHGIGNPEAHLDAH